MSINKKLILVIEDEPDIAELLEYNLKTAGYNVTKANNGKSGLIKAKKLKPDLILLDLMLPGIQGLDVCRIIKSDSETKSIFVIMLTALGQEQDIVKGLETGADDYILKPFSIKVLRARIKSVLRRQSADIDQEVVEINEVRIYPRTREVIVGDTKLNLTFTEFQILHLMLSHPGWVFTRYQIINKIRGDNYPITDRSVDFQIVGLRKKMREYGKMIETVRGVGYRFHPNES